MTIALINSISLKIDATMRLLKEGEVSLTLCQNTFPMNETI